MAEETSCERIELSNRVKALRNINMREYRDKRYRPTHHSKMLPTERP